MKRFLRNVLLPAVFMAAAVGASFYVGWSLERRLGEAELEALAPAEKPVHAPTRGGRLGVGRGFAVPGNAGPRNYLSLADAEEQVGAVLQGYLPEGIPSGQRALMRIANQMNPGDVAKLLDELPEGSARMALLQPGATTWMRAWTRQDTRAALEWVGTLDPAEAAGLYRAILAPIAADITPFAYTADPKIAAQYIDKLEDPALRNEAINLAASGLAKTDPAQALAWLGQVATGDAYQKDAAALFKTLIGPAVRTTRMPDGSLIPFGSDAQGQQNPEAAVALLAKVNDPAVRATAIGVMADGWSRLDPAQAMKWVASLPATDGPALDGALHTVLSNWAANDAAAALAYVEAINNPAAFQSAAPDLAAAVSQTNPDAAMNFVQSLPPGAARDRALNNVLTAVSAEDFSTAWGLAAALPAGTSRDAAMVTLVSVQAGRDPAQAVGLLDQVATLAERDNATRALAKAWVIQDPQAASLWMQALPPGSQRNTAVVELIPVVLNKDPASALNWANTLTVDTTRLEQVANVMTSWAKTDAAAALNALTSANIPEEKKTALANYIMQQQILPK